MERGKDRPQDEDVLLGGVEGLLEVPAGLARRRRVDVQPGRVDGAGQEHVQDVPLLTVVLPAGVLGVGHVALESRVGALRTIQQHQQSTQVGPVTPPGVIYPQAAR